MTLLAIAALALGVGAGIALNPLEALACVVGALILLALVGLSRTASMWRWCCLWLFVGYVVLSRAFAYVSVPSQLYHLLDVPQIPVYVGELVLVVCLASMPHRTALGRYLGTRPARVWLLWIVLGSLLVFWNIPSYGLAALRDSAVCYYALFAYVGYAFGSKEGESPRFLKLLGVAFLLHLVYSALYLSRIVDMAALSARLGASEVLYRQDVNAVNLLGGLVFTTVVARHFRWPTLVHWGVGAIQLVLFIGLQVRAGYVAFLAVLALLVYLHRVHRVLKVVPLAAFLLLVAVLLQVRLDIGRQFGGQALS